MHPNIRLFPSQHFYDGDLRDYKLMSEREMGPEFQKYRKMAEAFPNRVTFIDISYGTESPAGQSKSNMN